MQFFCTVLSFIVFFAPQNYKLYFECPHEICLCMYYYLGGKSYEIRVVVTIYYALE